MKLKLPFINRENYILITAYTKFTRVLENCPIVTSNMCVRDLPKPLEGETFNFSTCFGNTAGASRSITLPSYTEMFVDPDSQDIYKTPPDNYLNGWLLNMDNAYEMHKSLSMTKLIVPWMLKCNKKGMLFVAAKHIYNRLPMMIPTGMLNFDITHGPNIFNAVAKGLSYKIPNNYPLLGMYPISDLPIRVECVLDGTMFDYLAEEQHQRQYFRAGGIKHYACIKKGVDNA